MKKLVQLGLLFLLSFIFSSLVTAGTMQTLPAEKLIGTAKNYLHKTVPLTDYSLQLKSKIVAQKVPPGTISLVVKPLTVKNWGGNTRVPVQILVNGRKYRTIFISYDILVYQKVLVATQELKKGQPLDASNVTLERREISHLFQAPLTSLDSLIDVRTNRYLASGTILTKNYLESLPLVLKNKPVTLQAKVGAVEITTTVKALQDGRQGETIQVQNLASKKKIYALVTGRDLVEIKKN